MIKYTHFKFTILTKGEYVSAIMLRKIKTAERQNKTFGYYFNCCTMNSFTLHKGISTNE